MSSNAGITFPYLRRIEVKFSHLSDAFVSTGKQDDYKINARIHKAIQGIPSATSIMIHNLAAGTRSALSSAFLRYKVEIKAGWEKGSGPRPALCFRGTAFSAVHNRAGTDIVTSIHAVSMMEDLAREEIRLTWPMGQPIRDITLKLARLLPNVTVDASRVVGVKGSVGFKGWSHCGSVREALDQLAREYGFSWTIIDGYFQAVGDKDSIGGAVTIKDPYLVDVNPLLSGPLQVATGLKARCTFSPDLNPGRNIQIQSTISSRFNGQPYRMSSVVHNLDCFDGNSFQSEVAAFLPPGS